MLKFVLLVFALWLLVRFIDNSGQTSFCHGKVSVGTIWIHISDKNTITLGDKPFTEAALHLMHQKAVQSCDSVEVKVLADKTVKHKTVYDFIQRLNSMGFTQPQLSDLQMTSRL